MTRDAGNAQKFVQNIGPTIARRSRRIPDSTLMGGALNRGQGERGLIASSLDVCRARLRKVRQEDRYDLYLSAVDAPYYYGFYNGGQFAALVPIFAELVIGGWLHDLETCSAAHFLFLF